MRLSMQFDSGGARARSEERALGLTPFSHRGASVSLAWWCSAPSSKRRAVRCAASPLSTKKVRNPPIRGRFLTFVPPTQPVVEVALQQGGLSRVWTAPRRQRSWLSHWREKIFSQEPKIEAALKGRSMAQAPATRGIGGGHQPTRIALPK